MKHKIYRFLLFVGLITLSAFTLVPPVHQLPEGHKSTPEVVGEMPPMDSVTMILGGSKVEQGEQVCVPLTVEGFLHLLSIQFSIEWDTTVLQFSHLDGFGFKDLSDNNFGKQMVDDGHLSFLWYDQHLQGQSRPNGFQLYEVCFDAIGEPGASTLVEITKKPTIIEVVNVATEFLGLRQMPATVEILKK